MNCPKCGNKATNVEHFVVCYNYCEHCKYAFNQIDTQKQFRKLHREEYIAKGINIDTEGNLV